VKTNQEGRECPKWCVTDHSEPQAWTCSGPDRQAPGMRGGASARLGAYGQAPQVVAWLAGAHCGSEEAAVYAQSREDAARLAKFIEFAADARKPDLDALATNVREAAADAYPEIEPEAGS
jgi:hypothetical protein